MPNGEYSIEVDPRKVDFDTVKLLAELGFNRMSVGVQDFAEDAAGGQPHPELRRDQTGDRRGRANGFKSVSMDLIYGPPRQNPTSFDRTLDQVLEISPDRISLYSYAHPPGLFSRSAASTAATCPPPIPSCNCCIGIRRLTEAGYVYRHGPLRQA